MSDRAIQTLLMILSQAIFLSMGCGNQSADMTEDGKARVVTQDSRQEEELLTTPSSIEPTESDMSQDKPIQGTSPETGKKKSLQQQSLGEVDWGREVDLDEMIAMAKKGQIVEIQWHIMPNILRAEASDGEIFHLRNEDKGVDLRNTLINAGVKVGKGGVLFRHLF
jgi:hypothetical protein